VLGGLVSCVYEFGLLVILSMNEIGFIDFGLYFTGFNRLILVILCVGFIVPLRVLISVVCVCD
jgi:hypothetical protein